MIIHEEVEAETSKEGDNDIDTGHDITEHQLLGASVDLVEAEHGEDRHNVDSGVEDDVEVIGSWMTSSEVK